MTSSNFLRINPKSEVTVSKDIRILICMIDLVPVWQESDFVSLAHSLWFEFSL